MTERIGLVWNDLEAKQLRLVLLPDCTLEFGAPTIHRYLVTRIAPEPGKK